MQIQRKDGTFTRDLPVIEGGEYIIKSKVTGEPMAVLYIVDDVPESPGTLVVDVTDTGGILPDRTFNSFGRGAKGQQIRIESDCPVASIMMRSK